MTLLLLHNIDEYEEQLRTRTVQVPSYIEINTLCFDKGFAKSHRLLAADQLQLQPVCFDCGASLTWLRMVRCWCVRAEPHDSPVEAFAPWRFAGGVRSGVKSLATYGMYQKAVFRSTT